MKFLEEYLIIYYLQKIFLRNNIEMSKFGKINNSRFGNINHAYNKMNSVVLKPEIQTAISLPVEYTELNLPEPVKIEIEEKKEIEISNEQKVETKPENKLKRYNSLKLAVEQIMLDKKKKESGWTII